MPLIRGVEITFDPAAVSDTPYADYAAKLAAWGCDLPTPDDFLTAIRADAITRDETRASLDLPPDPGPETRQ